MPSSRTAAMDATQVPASAALCTQASASLNQPSCSDTQLTQQQEPVMGDPVVQQPDTSTEHTQEMDYDSSVPGSEVPAPCAKHATVPAQDTPPTKKVRATPDASTAPAPPCSSSRTAVYPTPPPDRSFRVHIKPTSRFDVPTIPVKLVQQVIDRCLGTQGYQGFVIHKVSNTITVHLASLDDVNKVCGITSIPISSDGTVTVHSYFASGPNVQRCVLYDLDPNDSPATILRELRSPTHEVLAVQRMGKSRTYLVTVQGSSTIPERFYYNACVLHPKPYRPQVMYCYRCFKLGHQQNYCPNATLDPERIHADGKPRYCCGLCKADDHEITSTKCPTKQRAPARAGRRESSSILKKPDPKKHRPPKHTPNDNWEFTEYDLVDEDLDAEIAQPSKQLETLRQKKACVAGLRKERAATHARQRSQNVPLRMRVNAQKTTPSDTAICTVILETLSNLTQLIQDSFIPWRNVLQAINRSSCNRIAEAFRTN
ncbi:hypothetical protein HPB48_015686 [Haemaphysalis longicornis]|uniref:CCHC-type domain-containing protein n=1 Tax=Haemaphysalis longicornis TaxID=44386 RepID=A0A9J6G973_HAELO|nr:hypothetical protein HPB48_015686 [Haemaphysalis longicornis]